MENSVNMKRLGTIGLVLPEPLASVARGILQDDVLGDLWKAETDCGGWTLIEIQPEAVAVSDRHA